MRFSIPALALCLSVFSNGAAEVFSGPQPGEKTTPFKVLDFNTTRTNEERDPIKENNGAPTAIVFLHAVERSMVPLLRAIDLYGSERTNLIKTEIVFLFGDRLAGEQRVKAVQGSIHLKGRVGLSLDGAEGPGNYGLNKECMMTIVAAKENKVTANFALVQPGIADAARVIQALAKTCGDTNPPTEAALQQSAMASGRMRETANANKPQEKFPGAVPTDPTLNMLLRQFIRPTNDVATVDRLRSEVQKHVQDNADLRKQAFDGWTRILHFGDHYGTEYSRKVGREMLEALGPAAK